MRVKELAKKFSLQVVAGKKGLNREVMGCYCGDLISDVMANAPPECIWLTIQSHQNIINVAEMKEMAAVVLANGLMPDDETRQRAENLGIPLILWPGSSYELAGKLSAAGI